MVNEGFQFFSSVGFDAVAVDAPQVVVAVFAAPLSLSLVDQVELILSRAVKETADQVFETSGV